MLVGAEEVLYAVVEEVEAPAEVVSAVTDKLCKREGGGRGGSSSSGREWISLTRKR